jgi:transposase
VKDERTAFQGTQANLDVDRAVFVDEAGINRSMTPKYGRAPKGERLFEHRPSVRSAKTSLIGAISLAGVVAFGSVEGSYNGARFLTWVTDELLPKLEPGTTIIWDNVRFHHMEKVRTAVEEAGCVLLKLPPYSPDLNPIEECWSKLKHLIQRAKARTTEALISATEAAIAALRPSDFAGWIEHAGYRIAGST